MTTVVFDLETDGLLRECSKLHVLAVGGDLPLTAFLGDNPFDTSEGLVCLAEADMLVGHNTIAFDLPTLKKLYPKWHPKGKIRDTLVYSQLLYPDMLDYDIVEDTKRPGKWIPKNLWGAHSLEAWGWRLGIKKGDFKGPWDVCTPEMRAYCEQDVAVTVALWERFQKEAQERLTEDAIVLEHRMADLCARMEHHGWLFDVQAAQKLTGKLMARRDALVSELRAQYFPPEYRAGPEFIPSRDNKTRGYVAGAPFCKVELIDFNPGSRQQIARRLQKQYGWKPVEFTDPSDTFPEGQPEVSEDVLSRLDYPCCPALVEYLTVEKRLGFVAEGNNSLLNHVCSDSRIRGRVKPCGTQTRRASHSSPNVAQTPAVGVPYGHEIRGLFMVPRGKKLVGCDADGLEARVMAHFMHPYDKGEFAWRVLEGKKEDGTDIHTVNQKLLQFKKRDNAKTWIYACVPMDTTALTRQGWKTYHELVVGEDVMTYNAGTGMKEWKPVLEKFHYEDAEIIGMSHSKGFVFRSTPDHRWYVRQRTGRREKYMVDEVRTTEQITTESNIIMNAPFAGDTNSTYKFVYGKWGTTWVDKVLAMSSPERRAFLQGFILADGHQDENGSLHWSQNENAISEALLLASYLEHPGKLHVARFESPTNTMIRVILSAKSHTTGQTLRKTRMAREAVWCIRTENNSFVARQGYTITITGNCIYGAGDFKLGLTCLDDMGPEAKLDITDEGDIKAAGKESRERVMGGLPALKGLMDDIKSVAKVRGWLKALDGARLQVRSEHAAPNTLFQSAGAVVMKRAALILEDKCIDKGWEFGREWALVGWIHDEFQIEVDEDKAEEMGKMAADAIKEAGDYYGFLCPLAGNYSIGLNWASTH